MSRARSASDWSGWNTSRPASPTAASLVICSFVTQVSRPARGWAGAVPPPAAPTGPVARVGAGTRVVVGDRHHVEARPGGAAHHLGGRVGPVRGSAVHMQVSTHQGAASPGRITGRAGAATRPRRAGPGPGRDLADHAGQA